MTGQSPLDILLIFHGSSRILDPCYSVANYGREIQSHGCFRERNSLGRAITHLSHLAWWREPLCSPQMFLCPHVDVQGSMALNNLSMVTLCQREGELDQFHFPSRAKMQTQSFHKFASCIEKISISL